MAERIWAAVLVAVITASLLFMAASLWPADARPAHPTVLCPRPVGVCPTVLPPRGPYVPRCTNDHRGGGL